MKLLARSKVQSLLRRNARLNGTGSWLNHVGFEDSVYSTSSMTRCGALICSIN